MVYPVSSPIQQQIPAANTFQPGGEAARRPPENGNLDATRPSGTDTARSSSSETRNFNRVQNSNLYDNVRSTDRSSDNGSVSVSSARGSNLDITA